ncbi:hypothetical protein MB9_0872 [Methanobacterium formicicum]|uniref:Uncharacterized protein n=1 Tax=Methanobacterium formicicum TaxID=2162 RepID=A0A0S4FN96_METFO|nr:hypothetical protein MB9_0872 [Methanobacterium formicicum]
MFQSQNGLILVEHGLPYFEIFETFQSQNGLILVCIHILESCVLLKFQSQNGLILVNATDKSAPKTV